MSVYLCRWPDGDLSLACGQNRLAIEQVSDEVGNPDSAELIPIKHPVAVHFHLKKKIERTFTVLDSLELEGIDESSFSDVCAAYPILDEVLVEEDATPEEITAAIEHEKKRVGNKLPESSDDPNVAMVQRLTDMPKRLGGFRLPNLLSASASIDHAAPTTQGSSSSARVLIGASRLSLLRFKCEKYRD